jgi:shikimate dehydrogenase
MKLKLAVIGDPVEHSLSPEYQLGFFSEYGIDGTFEAIRVPAGAGAAQIDALRAAGYAGLNVTTPLKTEAYARADLRDPTATQTGAVNTLLLGEKIAGYNTDGIGAVGALTDTPFGDPAGQTVLVLGAGATGRAVAFALIAVNADVLIWNRTPERASQLAHETGARIWSPNVPIGAVFSTLLPDAKLTDAELRDTVATARIIVDANYGERATLAAELGRPDVHDGRAMLRSSARASFEIFTSRH